MKWFRGNHGLMPTTRPGPKALLLLVALLAGVPASAAAQKSGSSAPAAAAAAPAATQPPASTAGSTTAPGAPQAAPTAIQVADVAAKAAEVAAFLQTLSDGTTHSEQIETIKNALPSTKAQSDQARVETLELLQRLPSLPALQGQEQQWQQIQRTYSDWLTTLTTQSNEIQDGLNQLATLQKVWALTLAAENAAKITGPSHQQVEDTLGSLLNAKVPLNNYLSQVLALQSEVGDEVAKSGATLAKITQLQQTAMSGTMVQDSLPIWSGILWVEAIAAVPEHIRNATASYRAAITNYLKTSAKRTLQEMAFLALLMVLFLVARYKVRGWATAGDEISRSLIGVFDHPFAASLTLALLMATSPVLSQMSSTLRDTLQLVALAPMIILLRPAVPRRLVPGLYVFWILFALDTLRESYYGDQLFGPFYLTLESLVGMAVMVWALRRLKAELKPVLGPFQLGLIRTVSGLVLLALATGLVTAALGYVRLSLLITPGVIAAAVLAIQMFAFLQIFSGVVALLFNAWPLRLLGMMKRHRALLERRIYHFLVWVAVFGVLFRSLTRLGLMAPFLTFAETILNTKIQRGIISISPAEILEFALTVLAAFLLSAFIRFVLREDVYPRLKLPQGNSYAISSLLHYFILAVGFTVAIAALGVNLTKLTVLSGAFGIGLGFGLQSVVNNFVSGLILLSERPIHVGDTVEIGSLVGSVQRIGIRASTVHTMQGADIIVPNSQMIADKVTNWTLSDDLRRIDLPVGINYGTNPETVISLLCDVALANPRVLRNPGPQTLMVGYGDSSVNFELRVWTDQFGLWPQIRSELAIAVYHAVVAAGMSFPFPQREVRVLRDIPEEKLPVPGQ